MQRIFPTLLVLLFLSACEQRRENIQKNVLTFKIFLYPSFDEKAEIVMTKTDTQYLLKFLLLDRFLPDKPTDTFYFKSVSLTKDQFDNFDSLIIQKTKIPQPLQRTGCCDGMPVAFLQIQGSDTSNLHYRSPEIGVDTSGYEITKVTIDQLGLIYQDSIITDYLHDIESYMDSSKYHIKWNENRAINRLRKIEYSR